MKLLVLTFYIPLPTDAVLKAMYLRSRFFTGHLRSWSTKLWLLRQDRARLRGVTHPYKLCHWEEQIYLAATFFPVQMTLKKKNPVLYFPDCPSLFVFFFFPWALLGIVCAICWFRFASRDFGGAFVQNHLSQTEEADLFLQRSDLKKILVQQKLKSHLHCLTEELMAKW